MNWKTFNTPITETGDALVGPWRTPMQMLTAQVYDEHASIHDDSTAQKFGFQGGAIEGPTHFSQFAPLCEHLCRLCLQRHRRHYISFRTMSGDEAGLAKFTCRWWILSALMPNDTRHSLLGITSY